MSAPSLRSIAEDRAAVLSGQTSVTALTEARLAAIPCGNGASPFTVKEVAHAMDTAARLDRALADGFAPGPLFGVPLAHKDMFDRAGQCVGFGAHRSARRAATQTATVLERLDAAGQVDLGRLAMSEFAMGPTGHNHQIGMPANPLVPGAITGGSSSGSGAAVAGGLVAAALGSDTGGSIRLPAACCGVVGFKPTQGRVPLTGAMPLSPSQDCVGPLAASVADAWTVLCIIAGADGRDPACIGSTLTDAAPAGSLRIGMDRGGFLTDLAPTMASLLDDTEVALGAEGHHITGIDLAFFDALSEPANVVAISDAAAVHADRLRSHADTYGPQIRARLAQAAAMPGHAYVRAQQIRQTAVTRLYETVFSHVDLIVLPTLLGPPPQRADVDVGGGSGLNKVIAGLTRLTRPASFLGLPAISLPVVWTEDGPLSLQIVGPHWQEARIATLARDIERIFAARPVTATANAALAIAAAE